MIEAEGKDLLNPGGESHQPLEMEGYCRGFPRLMTPAQLRERDPIAYKIMVWSIVIASIFSLIQEIPGVQGWNSGPAELSQRVIGPQWKEEHKAEYESIKEEGDTDGDVPLWPDGLESVVEHERELNDWTRRESLAAEEEENGLEAELVSVPVIYVRPTDVPGTSTVQLWDPTCRDCGGVHVSVVRHEPGVQPPCMIMEKSVSECRLTTVRGCCVRCDAWGGLQDQYWMANATAVTTEEARKVKLKERSEVLVTALCKDFFEGAAGKPSLRMVNGQISGLRFFGWMQASDRIVEVLWPRQTQNHEGQTKRDISEVIFNIINIWMHLDAAMRLDAFVRDWLIISRRGTLIVIGALTLIARTYPNEFILLTTRMSPLLVVYAVVFIWVLAKEYTLEGVRRDWAWVPVGMDSDEDDDHRFTDSEGDDGDEPVRRARRG